MSTNLKMKARKLSKQPYHIVVTNESTPEESIFFVSYLEMPGCMAQGESLSEALQELEEAKYEYILNYLQHKVPVPKPYGTTLATTGGVSFPLYAILSETPTEDAPSTSEDQFDISPEKPKENPVSITLGESQMLPRAV